MKNINARALSLATSWTMIFIVVITIWSEMSKPFKNILADLSGHHWVTKGILALIFFGLLYLILPKKTTNPEQNTRSEIAVVWVTIFSGLAIFIFYVWHFLTA